MSRRKSEADEYNALKKIGFELRAPVDEFSQQPSSGGVIGGRRGDQEFGITGGIAPEDSHDKNLTSNVDVNAADVEGEGQRFPSEVVDRDFPGLSEFASSQVDRMEGGDATDFKGQVSGEGEASESNAALLRQRYSDHPQLSKSHIEVRVEAGRVTIQGRVATIAERVLAEELAAAVLGAAPIENNIRITPVAPVG